MIQISLVLVVTSSATSLISHNVYLFLMSHLLMGVGCGGYALNAIILGKVLFCQHLNVCFYHTSMSGTHTHIWLCMNWILGFCCINAALLVNTAELSLPVSSNGVDGDLQTILGHRCHSAVWDCWTVHHDGSGLCSQKLESDPINHSCFMCFLLYIHMVRTFTFVSFEFHYPYWSNTFWTGYYQSQPDGY